MREVARVRISVRSSPILGFSRRGQGMILFFPAGDHQIGLAIRPYALPDAGDTVNLEFVRNVVGKPQVAGGAVISRTPNSFPFSNGFRAVSITELG